MKSKTFEQILSKMKNDVKITYCGKGNGTTCQKLFTISWVEKGRGFGTYSFFQDMNGQWIIDNECDNKESIKRIICDLIDKLPLRDKLQGKNDGNFKTR